MSKAVEQAIAKREQGKREGAKKASPPKKVKAPEPETEEPVG